MQSHPGSDPLTSLKGVYLLGAIYIDAIAHFTNLIGLRNFIIINLLLLLYPFFILYYLLKKRI